ncbi:MAG TPA: hypothetical protein VFK41_05760 [Nocardioidaceae bacterium]|nr:hypothetical protein [Nocardioidaceae bacterium]
MARDEGTFDEFTRARLPHLLMLARTLTCDDEQAELLVEECLAPVLDRWDESSPYTAEEEVRRALVRAVLRRTPVPATPEDPIWAALAGLGVRERAALALHLHEDLADEQAGDVLDCSATEAREAVERAVTTIDLEATRDAVLEPVILDESVLSEVRSRAAVRRRRRTLLTTVVTLAFALALGVAALAASGGSEVQGLDYPVIMMDASSPDTVWAMTRDRECPGCTVLWRGDGDGAWEAVYTFRLSVSRAQLLMAPDGENGYAWFASDHLEATHDGGRTWVVPELDTRDAQLEVALAGSTAYANLTRSSESYYRIFSSALGTDRWTEVPDGAKPGSSLVPFQDEVLVLDHSDPIASFLTRLESPDQVLVVPCTERDVVASAGMLWTTCSQQDGQRVLRSDDRGEEWRLFATVSRAAPAIYPISDTAVLMRSFDGPVLVSDDGVQRVDIDLETHDTIADVDFPSSEVGYVRTYAGFLYRSGDGGLTWSKVS